MNTGEGRGKSIEPTYRTLRSEGPPSQHYLDLTGIEQYSSLAVINTTLNEMSDSLSSSESVAKELMQENTKRKSITDELVESTKSLPIETQDPINRPVVQQLIENFESKSRSQSREDLTMASKEDEQEHLDEDNQQLDYKDYDSEDEVSSFKDHQESFEDDLQQTDLPQETTDPNKEFEDRLQPYLTEFKSQLENAAKKLAAEGPSFGGQIHAASEVLGTLTGAISKNVHSDISLPPPLRDNNRHVPSKQADGVRTGVGGETDGAGSNVGANVGPKSDEWILFKDSVGVLGSECTTELLDLQKKLGSSPTVPNIKYCIKEIQKNLEKLKRTLTRGEEMALRIPCPNRAETNKYINTYSKAFSQLEVHAEELLENKKPPAPQDPSLMAIGNLAQNLLGAAYAKPIELPEYDGECISDYTPFQKKFKYVITHCNTPKELWAQHLENSLKGKAKRYIGTQGSWFNKYDELWAHLDNKYANRWNIATEAVQNFFFQPEPEEDRIQTVDWFYTMKHNLDSLINLGLSMEEVGVNLILQKMPEVHAKEVRQALRTAHAGKDKKECFSMKTLTNVINDTIAVERLVTPQKPAQSTLNFVTQPTQPGTNTTAPPSSQKTYWGSGTGRGRARGRGRGTSNKTPKCWVHPIGNKLLHWSGDCPDYKTAKAKRAQVESQGRCSKCGQWAHPNSKCIPLPKECKYMDGKNGCDGKHWYYFCDEDDNRKNA